MKNYPLTMNTRKSPEGIRSLSMRYHITVCLSVLILTYLFTPPMAEAQTPAGPSIPEGITEQEVRLFIDDYIKRFMKMDLEAYMALFSKRAVENRALPYANIRRAYQRTIQVSQAIQYECKILTTQIERFFHPSQGGRRGRKAF